MTRTIAKVGAPAHWRGWGLTVDSMAAPTEFIVLQPAQQGAFESFQAAQRLPFVETSPQTLAHRTGMPEGTAAALLTQLAMKLASPKAAMADIGWRSVT